MRRLLPAILLAACSSACSLQSLDPSACPTGGTKLTYDNFGATFFAGYCNSCHSAEVGHRNGAPEDYRFDSREAIAAHKERIFERSAGTNDSMPPGPDDPPLGEREQLAEWLDCGAP